jgi:hypothetical protein
VLQFGFLDGKRGLAFCMLQAYASYLKWSLLWSWRVNAALGRDPPLPAFDDDPAVWAGLDRLRTRTVSDAPLDRREPGTQRVAARNAETA